MIIWKVESFSLFFLYNVKHIKRANYHIFGGWKMKIRYHIVILSIENLKWTLSLSSYINPNIRFHLPKLLEWCIVYTCCGSVHFWDMMKNLLYCDISYNSKVPVQKDALINGRKLPYTTFNDLIMINSTII